MTVQKKSGRTENHHIFVAIYGRTYQLRRQVLHNVLFFDAAYGSRTMKSLLDVIKNIHSDLWCFIFCSQAHYNILSSSSTMIFTVGTFCEIN